MTAFAAFNLAFIETFRNPEKFYYKELLKIVGFEGIEALKGNPDKIAETILKYNAERELALGKK